MERHYDRVYRLAWRLTGSQTTAEDVAQDVCVKLASALGHFRAEAKFTTWLHRLTYTTAIDHGRRNQRLLTLAPSDMATLLDAAAAVPPRDAAGLSDGDLWQAVSNLPAQQRQAVVLVFAEEMSHAEAATVMGIAESTVSWHIHAAKKRLKTWLEAVG